MKEPEELLRGKDGEKLRTLAASEEARRVSSLFSPQELEQAARSGDGAQLRGILQRVLSTEEGRALAQKLSQTGKTHD